MNTNIFKISALSGLIAAGGIATMVSAQTVAEQTNLTEEQVIEIALMEVPGEVTDVDVKERRGNAYFEVEIIAEDGDAMEVRIADESGEVQKVSAADEDCSKDRDQNNDDDDGEDA